MPQELLIRDSPKEGALRSVGAAPNGIVSVRAGEGEATLTIDSKFLVEERGSVHIQHETEEDADRRSVSMEIAEVVAACESPTELFRLSAMLIATSQAVIGQLAPDRDWPTIRAMVDLLEDTLTAVETSLHERGIG